jgi:hypothetical protein
MKPKLLTCGLSLLIAAAALFGIATVSQAADKESEDQSFQKYGQEFKGKIGRTYAESQEWYPEVGVDPTLVSPAAKSITREPIASSC